MKPSNVEVNGPANIQMILDLMLETGRISKEDHNILSRQAKGTIAYMRQLSNDKNIAWSEVIKQVA